MDTTAAVTARCRLDEGALAMLLGESRRRDVARAAVRPDLVEVAAPLGDRRPGLLQCLEPLLVQALVGELAVEALDVAVLHGLAWLDQDVSHAVLWLSEARVRALSGGRTTIFTQDGALLASHTNTMEDWVRPLEPCVCVHFANAEATHRANVGALSGFGV